MGLFRKNKAEPFKIPVREVKTRRSTIIVYFAKDGWRWRLVAPNGHITAESGESYIRRFDCVEAARALSDRAKTANLEVKNR